MPFDCFLTLDGIDGESTDSNHTNAIELLSFSFGATQAVGSSASTGGARSGERVALQDFAITKVLDKASPKIFLNCCNGTHISTVTIDVCRATGSKETYMTYEMEDVLITSYTPSGASGGELPIESVTFNPAKITLTYTVTDHDTGDASGNVTANWSQETNSGS